MITPLYLSQGDKIAIIAPAGKIEKNVVNGARRTLEQWGLEVVPGNHLFDNDFSFAATDDKRMKDFQDMLDDPSVKAVLCARGGYGSVRIIDNLDFSTFIKNPKWIIGFSDILCFIRICSRSWVSNLCMQTWRKGCIKKIQPPTHYIKFCLEKNFYTPYLFILYHEKVNVLVNLPVATSL
ncbi:MAG: LD-carboxypeptidase [Bacteroidales bacterium]|nr:LD-carboxypeptidase [Bacteroidales bacterium]